MKNWLRYMVGSYENQMDPIKMMQLQQSLLTGAPTPVIDKTTYVWHEQGFTYVDPAAVISVSEHTEPRATIISTCDGKQIVLRDRSAHEVIGDIQSALS